MSRRAGGGQGAPRRVDLTPRDPDLAPGPHLPAGKPPGIRPGRDGSPPLRGGDHPVFKGENRVRGGPGPPDPGPPDPLKGGLDRHSRPKTRAGHPKPILAGVAFRTKPRVHPGPRPGPGDPRN